MSKLQFRADQSKSQATLSIFVMVLTAMVVIFSTYMSASFWAGLGATKHASLMFALLGVFLELAKICAGIAIIVANAAKDRGLQNISILVLIIFSVISFIASVSTISDQMKIGRNDAHNANEEIKIINYNIQKELQILDALTLSQKNDIEHGYRARSNQTLMQIKQEQKILDDLLFMKDKVKDADYSTLSVISMLDSLISFGKDRWEIAITLILGTLTEATGLFLLYLNFTLIKVTYPNNKKHKKRLSHTYMNKAEILPISQDEYREITNKIVSGKIVPTQRNLKNVVRLGNENIAKIFAKWVQDGILVKTGKSYRVAA
jgi:hypothetical protein